MALGQLQLAPHKGGDVRVWAGLGTGTSSELPGVAGGSWLPLSQQCT